MSRPPPDLGQRPPSVNGGSPERDGLGEAPTVVSSRAKRQIDHRFRGLDVGEQDGDQSPTRPKASEQLRRRRRRRVLTRAAVLLGLTVTVAVILRTAVVQPFSVPSSAMTPTLDAGDRILVVKAGLLMGPIKRGEIVVFRGPDISPCSTGPGDTRDLVKRVIGLPGETISSVGTTIEVDGRRLNEPGWYDVRSGPVGSTPIRRTTIPAGDYFVMGDSRTNSCDSRSFGPVPRSAIVGKVVAVLSRDGHPHFQLL